MADENKTDLQNKDWVDKENGEVKKKRRSRKVIGEEGSRKQTAIGLLITICLGLVFYLPREIKQWWEKFNTAETITIERPIGDTKDVSEVVGFKVEIKKQEDAEEIIRAMTENLSGDYGIYAKKLEEKEQESLMIKGMDSFTAASVIKLPVLVVYYLQVDAGKIDPEEIYVLDEKDRWEYGTGSMQYQPAGTEYSYKRVAYLTANQSDNMGFEVLIKKMGGYALVQKEIDKLGLGKTNLKENETSPEDVGKLLSRLYGGEILSEKSQKELFDNLTDTVLETRLPAGVPTGVRVVHKFGSEVGVVNDCGVVYGNDPYVVCILSTNISDGEAEGLMPKVSRVIWEWVRK